MKIFALIMGMCVALVSTAHGYERDIDSQFRLNQGSQNSLAKTQLGDLLMVNSIRSQKCSYSFALQGGAIGTINLQASDGAACKIPGKALIVNAWVDVITTPTSGGSATLAFSSGQTAADLLAATAKASVTGEVQGIPTMGTISTALKITGATDLNPYLTVATAALTAGKANVFIQYVLSN